jgi:hypothetical protein
MSIVDLILGQKVILISFGIAVLFILFAVTMIMLPRIKARRARLAQERAVRQAAEAEAAAERAALEEAQQAAAAVARAAGRKGGKQAGGKKSQNPGKASPATAAPVAYAPTAAPVAQAVKAPAAKPPTPAPAPPTPAATSSTEGEPSSEMKDILSSVFGDDENSERQAALMRGMDSIEMTHLLTLSQQVAAQLRGKQPVKVVGSEEL